MAGSMSRRTRLITSMGAIHLLGPASGRPGVPGARATASQDPFKTKGRATGPPINSTSVFGLNEYVLN